MQKIMLSVFAIFFPQGWVSGRKNFFPYFSIRFGTVLKTKTDISSFFYFFIHLPIECVKKSSFRWGTSSRSDELHFSVAFWRKGFFEEGWTNIVLNAIQTWVSSSMCICQQRLFTVQVFSSKRHRENDGSFDILLLWSDRTRGRQD